MSSDYPAILKKTDPDAVDVLTDTVSFNGILSSSDIDVQTALETIDDINTDSIPEGSTNFYYTEARFDASLATKTTDDLTEGVTNLYFTTARAQAVIDADTTLLKVDGSRNATGSQQFEGLTTTAAVEFNTGDADVDFLVNGLSGRAYYYDASTDIHRFEGADLGAVGVNQANPEELFHVGDNNDANSNFVKVQSGSGLEAGVKMVGGNADIWEMTHSDSDNNLTIGLNTEDYAEFTNERLTINPDDLDYDFRIRRSTASGGGNAFIFNAGADEAQWDVLNIFSPSSDAGQMVQMTTEDENRTMQLTAPLNGDNTAPFIWSTNNSFAWQVDGDTEFEITSTGNVVFNVGTNNRDFTVNGSSGAAYNYDGGTTDHTFNGELVTNDFHVHGTQSVTGATTVTESKVFCTNSGYTVTMPASPVTGQEVTIFNQHNSGFINISTIEGIVETLYAGESLDVVYDGANWVA